LHKSFDDAVIPVTNSKATLPKNSDSNVYHGLLINNNLVCDNNEGRGFNKNNDCNTSVMNINGGGLIING
jgi:hypothetical protein